MSTEDDEGLAATPPADWQSITPERAWAEVTKLRGKLATEKAAARSHAERVAQLEAETATLKPAAGRVADLEAQLARTSTRLGMARGGVVDDEVAEIAEGRYTRYTATAGKDALPLDAWLTGPAREDRILAPLLQAPPVTATPAQVAPQAKAPMVPAPGGVQSSTAATTAEDVARIRAANNGRLPAAVQTQVGTMVDAGDLLRGLRR